MIIERRCVRVLLPHLRRVTPPTRRTPDFAGALGAKATSQPLGGLHATHRNSMVADLEKYAHSWPFEKTLRVVTEVS
jgi:hypothetical protein